MPSKRTLALLAPLLLAMVLVGVYGKMLLIIGKLPPHYFADPFNEGLEVEGTTVILNVPTAGTEEVTPWAITIFDLPAIPSTWDDYLRNCGDDGANPASADCQGYMAVLLVKTNETIQITLTHGGLCGLAVARDLYTKYGINNPFYVSFTAGAAGFSSGNPDVLCKLISCWFRDANTLTCMLRCAYSVPDPTYGTKVSIDKTVYFTFTNTTVVTFAGKEYAIFLINSTYWYGAKPEEYKKDIYGNDVYIKYGLDMLYIFKNDGDGLSSNILLNGTATVLIIVTAGQTYAYIPFRIPYMMLEDVVRTKFLNVYPVYCFTFYVENLGSAAAQVNITLVKVEKVSW